MSAATSNKKLLGFRRVELQLNRRFLVDHEIKEIFDFQRLQSVLPIHHIFFALVDEKKVRQRLRSAGLGHAEIRRIVERLRDCDGNLLQQCAVLRKNGGLKNIRRLLIPLTTNQLVISSLKKWINQWPQAPTRLGNKI